MSDGQERPIAFASRTLNQAEKKYSQLEKEGLAIIFRVKKFRNYIYGTHFAIQLDQKPLSSLFSEIKSIPVMASSRIQRWALTLAVYQYSILYKIGKSLNNADALSRLPQPDMFFHDGLAGDVVPVMDHLSTTVISCPHIQRWTLWTLLSLSSHTICLTRVSCNQVRRAIYPLPVQSTGVKCH